jgi:hypothetical protein
MTSKLKAGPAFYGLLIAIGFLTYGVHELAHWLAGLALGHDMTLRLNGVAPTTAVPPLDAMLISIAGPAVTILQAGCAAGLAVRHRSLAAYGFLYWAAFMRFAATLVSLFHPNDEARVSSYLGLGAWTLPILVTVALVGVAWLASRALRLSVKTNVLAYLVVSVTTAAIVGLDAVLR